MNCLSPSILSADFVNLERDIQQADDAGAQYIHIDVMDGHFVPPITIGADVVSAIRGITDKVLDCHLMVENPGSMIADFAAAGADIVTVHAEACTHQRSVCCTVYFADFQTCGAVLNGQFKGRAERIRIC